MEVGGGDTQAQIIMVGQLSAVKGAGELGGVKRLWRRWWWWLDQYTSQFLMRERIGPSQADGNPASLCLGWSFFTACQQAIRPPPRPRLRLFAQQQRP